MPLRLPRPPPGQGRKAKGPAPPAWAEELTAAGPARPAADLPAVPVQLLLFAADEPPAARRPRLPRLKGLLLAFESQRAGPKPPADARRTGAAPSATDARPTQAWLDSFFD